MSAQRGQADRCVVISGCSGGGKSTLQDSSNARGEDADAR